jgi:DNA-binding CsgD family transcriptional regulator
MLVGRPSAPVDGEASPTGAGAKARFMLDGRLCVVFDNAPSRLNAPQVGSLTIGNREYVVSLAASTLPPPRSDLLDLLSPRELEIAMHIAAGRNAKLVARRLRISFHTVRVHLSRIYAKLGLHKQTELAALIAAQFDSVTDTTRSTLSDLVDCRAMAVDADAPQTGA